MQGAQNGPGIDEVLVGPRHWVAGGPVGHKHGMRHGIRGRGQERSGARAAPKPLENRNRAGDVMRQRGTGYRGVANETEHREMAEGAKQQPRGIGKPVAMEW